MAFFIIIIAYLIDYKEIKRGGKKFFLFYYLRKYKIPEMMP